MKTTLFATLLLATLFATTALATAQGLTREITIGLHTLVVHDGRIVGLTEPPTAPATTPSVTAPIQRIPPASPNLQRLEEIRGRRVASGTVTPLPPAAARRAAATEPAPAPVTIGPEFTISLSSGVRVTVTATNTFDGPTLQRILREASQVARKSTARQAVTQPPK